MFLLFTFCCDIGKHTRPNLIKVFNLLLNSIHTNIESYKLICFTNFKNELTKNISKKYNIEFREYYDKEEIKLYQSVFYNLSFNKVNIYKDLYDEFNKDFCWIDLDTIICRDISYINDLSNVFLEIGGDLSNNKILFSNDKTITVPRKNYIQGNFWKININLYNNLMITLDELKKKNLKLRLDLQDLFNYFIYIKNNGEYNKFNINILGNNIMKDSINGIALWCRHKPNNRARWSGLKNLYLENNVLKTKLYPDKNIHILSFTFPSLVKLYDNSPKKFKQLGFNNSI